MRRRGRPQQSQVETFETYGLLGIAFDIMYTNPTAMDSLGLVQASWPEEWRKVPVEGGAYKFQLVDATGTPMVEGTVNTLGAGRKPFMRLTEQGRQAARRRWGQLSWWQRRKINRAGGPWNEGFPA